MKYFALFCNAIAAFLATTGTTYAASHELKVSLVAGIVASMKDIISYIQNPQHKSTKNTEV